jgi:hypothetical protein
MNPAWSDFVCLSEAVRGQQFTRRRLYSSFIKIVDSEDYDKSDVNKLVRHLSKVSKQVEECTFWGKNAPEMTKNNLDVHCTENQHFDVMRRNLGV